MLDNWQQTCEKFEKLAAEIPADHQYDWRPRADVRTPAEVIRHVAFWNNYVADIVRGNQADDSTNELPASNYHSKKEIIDALQQSADGAAAAIRDRKSELDPKTTDLVIAFLEHTSEHYGQLAVYARLLDVTPPASRT